MPVEVQLPVEAVVSRIGFLGAGVIMKDGSKVWGLNTAATLWCSAAVGVLSGIGQWPKPSWSRWPSWRATRS